MLRITYTHLCDACGAEIGTENYALTSNSVVPQPRPGRFGAHPGGWFYSLCEGCFEPLRGPLREVAKAGLAKKESRK